MRLGLGIGLAAAAGGSVTPAPPDAPLSVNNGKTAAGVGDTAGGFTVTITVGDSTGLTGAKIGDLDLTSFAIVDDTHVSGVIPDLTTPGLYDVVVSNAGGDSDPLANGWRAWDPSAITTAIWLREDRTTSGSDVTQWTDKSGNGRDFTPNDVGAVVGSALNGHPTITWDGGANSYFVSGVALSTAASASAIGVYAVFKVHSINGDNAAYYNNEGITGEDGGYWGINLKKTGAHLAQWNWDGNEDDVVEDITLDAWTLGEWGHTGGNILSRLNNGTQHTTASGNTQSAGGALKVGGAYGNFSFDGSLAEVIYLAAPLSGTNAGYMRAYAMTRYNL